MFILVDFLLQESNRIKQKTHQILFFHYLSFEEIKANLVGGMLFKKMTQKLAIKINNVK